MAMSGLPTMRRILMAAVLALAAAAASAQAPDPTPISWRFQVTPYVWGPGMKGTIQIPNAPELKVDVPFADAISNLNLAFLGRFEGRKGDFGVYGDLLYVHTDADFAPDQPPVANFLSPVETQQLYADAVGFYRLWHAPDFERAYVDFLVGVRYFQLRAEVGTTQGTTLGSRSRWLDLIGGFRGRVPLGSKFGLLARGDVGGLGSKLSYNLEGSLDMSISDRWTVGIGYRHLDYDFETGMDAQRRAANLYMSGPLIKATFTY